jgi:hypothetical protein
MDLLRSFIAIEPVYHQYKRPNGEEVWRELLIRALPHRDACLSRQGRKLSVAENRKRKIEEVKGD